MTIVPVPASASDMCTVTAAELHAYRDVVRTGLAPAAGPSPLHTFVLSTGVFDQVVEQVGAGAAVVHLSQEIRIGRPVHPGERVAITLDVLAARREPRGARLALRCLLHGDDGTALAELTTGVLLGGVAGPEPFGDVPPPPRPVTGSARETVTRTIGTATVHRYADVSGDRNPIHLDPAAGRAAGFPGAIVHGMCVVAVAVEEIVDRHAGGDAGRVRGLGARFSAPVLPDEPLDVVLTPGDGYVGFSCSTPRGPAIKAGWVQVAGKSS